MKDLVIGSEFENCAWAGYIVLKTHQHLLLCLTDASYQVLRDISDYYTADVKARGEGTGPSMVH